MIVIAANTVDDRDASVVPGDFEPGYLHDDLPPDERIRIAW